MIKLIPVSQEADNYIRRELEKSTGLTDVEKFISLYNQKMYQANNQKIAEIIELIEKSYINVESNKNYITIMSEEESVLVHLGVLIKQWKFISALKSLAVQMLNEGYPTFERIIFERKKGGYPFIIDPNDNAKLKKHWSNKALTQDYKGEIEENPFLVNIREEYSDREDGSMLAFEIGTVAQIDDSFVLSIRDYIAEEANKAIS